MAHGLCVISTDFNDICSQTRYQKIKKEKKLNIKDNHKNAETKLPICPLIHLFVSEQDSTFLSM